MKKKLLTILTGSDMLLFIKRIKPFTRSLKKRRDGETMCTADNYKLSKLASCCIFLQTEKQQVTQGAIIRYQPF